MAHPDCPAGYEPLISYVDDGPPAEWRLPVELVRAMRDRAASGIGVPRGIAPYTLERGDFSRLGEALVPPAASGPERRIAATVPDSAGLPVAVFTYSKTASGWWLSGTSECGAQEDFPS